NFLCRRKGPESKYRPDVGYHTTAVRRGMNAYIIQKVGPQAAPLVKQLGTAVYHTTYQSTTSGAQIDFMLQKNYTPEAIQQVMADGQEFYILTRPDRQPFGFIAL